MEVKTAGEFMHNAKQCIFGGAIHDGCINEHTRALCRCSLPRVLM